MLAFGSKVRIFVNQEPTDMRKGFEGLCAEVELHLTDLCEELLSGAFFVFLNRTQDRMKVLYWDSDGLAIWCKRLEKGTFIRPKTAGPSIDRREFLMMLEGVVPMSIKKRHKIC
jgi:transposase